MKAQEREAENCFVWFAGLFFVCGGIDRGQLEWIARGGLVGGGFRPQVLVYHTSLGKLTFLGQTATG